MQQLPLQMKAKLKHTHFHLGRKVKGITKNSIQIEGESLEFDAVVQAFASSAYEFYPVTTDYFSCDQAFTTPILYLSSNSKDIINHVAPMSAANPAYAPEGKSLLAVNLLGEHYDTEVSKVKKELEQWFDGIQFEHLRRYNIQHALPKSPEYLESVKTIEGVFQCGDHLQQPSINGALKSGRLAASAIKSYLEGL
jgi:hypothetical protein